MISLLNGQFSISYFFVRRRILEKTTRFWIFSSCLSHFPFFFVFELVLESTDAVEFSLLSFGLSNFNKEGAPTPRYKHLQNSVSISRNIQLCHLQRSMIFRQYSSSSQPSSLPSCFYIHAT